MLTFAHIWLYLLLPVPLLVRWLVPPRQASETALQVPFLKRLKSATSGQSPVRRVSSWYDQLVLWAIWVLVLSSLARPQWLEPPIERVTPLRDLLLLVDLSGSMSHEDFTNGAGQQVDRLTAVKEVLGEFLLRREGDRVGLVVFGNSPFLQVPFTTDLELCRQLLDELAVGMAGPRTALGDGIGLGIQLFDNSDEASKTMIVLTDGNDTGSDMPPPEAARVAADRGITIYAVAIGDPETVGEEKLDVDSLRKVTESTGGEFFLALDRDQLVGIYDKLDQLETREVKVTRHRPRQDLFYWPLLLALLVSLGTTAGGAFRGMARSDTAEREVRVRVNSRTFELETVDK